MEKGEEELRSGKGADVRYSKRTNLEPRGLLVKLTQVIAHLRHRCDW